MPGYPKIWDSIMDEEWFIELSATARGIFLQLILLAKKQGGTGRISCKNWSDIAHRVGADRATIVRTVRKFQHLCKIEITTERRNILTLFLPKYKKWQQVKNLKEINNVEKSTKQKNRQDRDRDRVINKKEETVVSSGKPESSHNPPKSKSRSPAQKWNDGVIDKINLKLKEYWNDNTTISQIIQYHNKAERSLGRVIVCLERIREYELKTEPIKNLQGRIIAELRGWTRWPDIDLTKIKQIDNKYESEFKSKNSIKTIGNILNNHPIDTHSHPLSNDKSRIISADVTKINQNSS